MSAKVRTLFLAQALAMCATPLMIFSAALATREFAPSSLWTTLPAAGSGNGLSGTELE